MEWCTIESDPAVFSELLEKIGAKDIAVEEVYDLDDRAFIESLGTIYGFIFLFRYTSNKEKRSTLQDYDPDLYFAKQIVTNACGTQAVLSVVMNIPDLKMGEDLKTFREFCMPLDAETRGEMIGESELLRVNHNKFAKPERFDYQTKRKAKDGDDVFHFIAYVPFKKQVYELDGIEKGPILLGEVTEGTTWIDVAREAINKRVERYAAKEIRFNLLAVIKSRGAQAEHHIRSLKKEKGSIYETLASLEGPAFDQSAYHDFDECVTLANSTGMKAEIPGATVEGLKNRLTELDTEVALQEDMLTGDKATKEEQRIENSRRQHDYIPFILELLKVSAEKGELTKQYEKAKEAVAASKQQS